MTYLNLLDSLDHGLMSLDPVSSVFYGESRWMWMSDGGDLGFGRGHWEDVTTG